ncbi:MAG: hypothetical protein ACQEXV_23675 [Bacillota bacterium]
MIKTIIRRLIIRYLHRNHGTFYQDGVHVAVMSKNGYKFFRTNVNDYLNKEDATP